MTLRRGPLVLLSPAFGVFAVCFVLPAAYFFVVSFWQVRSYRLVKETTAENYLRVFTDYSGPLLDTLVLAFIVATTVTGFAFFYVYLCRFKAGRFAPLLLFAAMLTLFGGYLTKIYMWRTILGDSGILNASLITAGLIEEPISVFLFNPVAVVITLGHYLVPFAILPLYGVMHAIRDDPLEAARDLGASRWHVFRHIVLPQCRTGIVAAFTLTFLFTSGDFATARLVGGPDASLFGVFVQGQFTQRLNQPMGAAMAFTMLACCLVVVSAVALGVRRAVAYR
ncbi:MAG: ABC transporter permease [Azospirillaceae bacterium]